MSKKNIIAIFCFLSLLNFVANAQNKVHCSTKTEKKLVDAIQQLTLAMIEADSVTLDKLCSDHLSYGHSGGTVEGKKDFIDKIISGRSDFVNIDITEQHVSISGKTAIVRHILNAKTNDKGVSGEVHLKVLLVWQKQNGHWKLLARQAVKLTV